MTTPVDMETSITVNNIWNSHSILSLPSIIHLYNELYARIISLSSTILYTDSCRRYISILHRRQSSRRDFLLLPAAESAASSRHTSFWRSQRKNNTRMFQIAEPPGVISTSIVSWYLNLHLRILWSYWSKTGRLPLRKILTSVWFEPLPEYLLMWDKEVKEV